MVLFVRNRQDLEHQIILMHAEGMGIRALSRHFAMGRNTIRRIIRKNHSRREKGHDVLTDQKAGATKKQTGWLSVPDQTTAERLSRHDRRAGV